MKDERKGSDRQQSICFLNLRTKMLLVLSRVVSRTAFPFLISPSIQINSETKWRYTEFPTKAAGFC